MLCPNCEITSPTAFNTVSKILYLGKDMDEYEQVRHTCLVTLKNDEDSTHEVLVEMIDDDELLTWENFDDNLMLALHRPDEELNLVNQFNKYEFTMFITEGNEYSLFDNNADFKTYEVMEIAINCSDKMVAQVLDRISSILDNSYSAIREEIIDAIIQYIFSIAPLAIKSKCNIIKHLLTIPRPNSTYDH